jgi:hypothetical protein
LKSKPATQTADKPALHLAGKPEVIVASFLANSLDFELEK